MRAEKVLILIPGMATVNYEGEKAMVIIKGTTKEEPAMNLTMTCNKVTTVNNPEQ